MGERARRAMMRRTTGGERIDLCLRMSDEFLTRYIGRVPIPDGADKDECARIQFRALRKLGE